MIQIFEKFYKNDNKTAYIMTSDHGMSDWGSHGSGHPDETLTPIVAWGAGIQGPRKHHGIYGKEKDSFSKAWELEDYERSDISQIDVAALMSAVIGKFRVHFNKNPRVFTEKTLEHIYSCNLYLS